MYATANTSNQPGKVQELLIRTRSIKGEPLPWGIIQKCIAICEETGYHFVVQTGTALSRKKSFFWAHKAEMFFYNKEGECFDLDEKSKELAENEQFFGIYFDSYNNEATLYAYFPYDGAMR